MFRKMRRKNQQLSPQDSREILRRNTAGVLAVEGDGGYPYAVPLSYVWDEDRLLFHCGKSGHKLDSLRRNPKASFCVVDEDRVVPEEYTTYFRSVIVFGRARILEREPEKREAIRLLALKYHPLDTEEHRARAIQKDYTPLCMVELAIEHMTGKEAVEYTRQRRSQTGRN